ncbi:hypothetical protein [Nocardiopsis composta]|uniref:Uncharacterized protein n=1 Tax=Nocardiopsis composta TaxID=157465 RepID=A0A7W8VCF8_9ACTN|nr:hypothetical protein [Nocardiopsis composta]MBB5430854.1 hypothetical protein [Nocardiopsis composta]
MRTVLALTAAAVVWAAGGAAIAWGVPAAAPYEQLLSGSFARPAWWALPHLPLGFAMLCTAVLVHGRARLREQPTHLVPATALLGLLGSLALAVETGLPAYILLAQALCFGAGAAAARYLLLARGAPREFVMH